MKITEIKYFNGENWISYNIAGADIDTSNLVDLSSAQTINGQKTFTKQTIFNVDNLALQMKRSQGTAYTGVGANTSYRTELKDSNNTTIAGSELRSDGLYISENGTSSYKKVLTNADNFATAAQGAKVDDVIIDRTDISGNPGDYQVVARKGIVVGDTGSGNYNYNQISIGSQGADNTYDQVIDFIQDDGINNHLILKREYVEYTEDNRDLKHTLILPAKDGTLATLDDTSNLVDLSSNETITGIKTFSNNVIFSKSNGLAQNIKREGYGESFTGIGANSSYRTELKNSSGATVAGSELRQDGLYISENGTGNYKKIAYAPQTDIGFENPLISNSSPDPTVWEEDGIYHMACTNQGNATGFNHYVSTDLVTWQVSIDVLMSSDDEDIMLGEGHDVYSSNLWAAQVTKVNGYLKLYCCAHNNGTTSIYALDRATSGSYMFTNPQLITGSSSLGVWCSDPYVVQGMDGKIWLFFGGRNGVHCIELNSSGTALANNAKKTKLAGLDSFSGTRPQNVYEGSTVFYYGGYWYLLASGGYTAAEKGADNAYYIGVARSKTINGIYKNMNGEPVTDGSALLTPILTSNDNFYNPGHTSNPFIDNEGNWYIMFHAIDGNKIPDQNLNRYCHMLPIYWNDNMWPIIGETSNPQQYSIAPKVPVDMYFNNKILEVKTDSIQTPIITKRNTDTYFENEVSLADIRVGDNLRGKTLRFPKNIDTSDFASWSETLDPYINFANGYALGTMYANGYSYGIGNSTSNGEFQTYVFYHKIQTGPTDYEISTQLEFFTFPTNGDWVVTSVQDSYATVMRETKLLLPTDTIKKLVFKDIAINTSDWQQYTSSDDFCPYQVILSLPGVTNDMVPEIYTNSKSLLTIPNFPESGNGTVSICIDSIPTETVYISMITCTKIN